MCLLTINNIIKHSALGYSFIEGIVFASSTLTTLGILGPPKSSPEGVFILTGLIILTGVPIAASALGNLASKITEPYQLKRVDAMIDAPFDEEERMLLEYLNATDGNRFFDKQEYLIFLLVRGGLLDVDVLRRIYDKFEHLDIDSKGKISIAELIAKYNNDTTKISCDIRDTMLDVGSSSIL